MSPTFSSLHIIRQEGGISFSDEILLQSIACLFSKRETSSLKQKRRYINICEKCIRILLTFYQIALITNFLQSSLALMTNE